MLKNLKLVLIQHKRFLAIFFFVVFLPSIILAVFGIRAIQNERYKHQQQNLEQQKHFVRSVQLGIQTLIERNSSSLMELSSSKAIFDRDYRSISDSISFRLRDQSLFGHVVIWNSENSTWIPALQPFPPDAKFFLVPEEWRKWQADLEMAEAAEFRRKDFAEAVTLYNRMLNRAEHEQVKAWILSRLGRCEVKQEKFKQALVIFRSVIDDYPHLFTESGRPLNLVLRLERLDAFRSDRDYGAFFRESLHTYNQLLENSWALDGDQIRLYSNMLKKMIDDIAAESSPSDAPAAFSAAVSEIQESIDNKLKIWRLAEAARHLILPSAGETQENADSDSPQVQKNEFKFEGSDVLVFWISPSGNGSGRTQEILGSLLRINDLTETIEDLVAKNSPPGVSLRLLSNLSDSVIFGDPDEAQKSPVFTDIFPENFPPWRLELYQIVDGKAGYALYKNIFFWTILALLSILLFGSGLIIRTIIHELNLLNLKSEFIASVSHEFKTPLTSMGAVIESLLDDEVKNPEKAKEYYRILNYDSERLKRLVRNVLDFTKIEGGKREYNLAPNDIAGLVRREVESFERENNGDSIKVGVEISEGIPLVSVDEEAMNQALHNILDNATKFSGREKNINVEVARKGNSVEIAVRDNGIGIPENEQKRIFEKFYRGKQASLVSPTGTGLGLTLVKHIMDAHGGDIITRSRPGEGSCISLVLPIPKGG